jgi:hypothetical protein
MKTFKIILAIAIGTLFIGCSGKPIIFKSINPSLYQDVKERGRTISAEAEGFQLLLFIPIDINDRHERALAKLKVKANGDYITDIKIKESWSYGFIGTWYKTTITATAYPKTSSFKSKNLNFKDKLLKIEKLYKMKILTEEEYNTKRKNLINNF